MQLALTQPGSSLPWSQTGALASQSPDGDAPTGWRSAAEFTLTLQSGQTVEVTFLPCLVGLSRMHEFSFTGPVSPTGFKSHFVLAAESEQFRHPRDYAQAYAEAIVAQHQKKLKKAKSTKRAHQQMTNEQDDCGNSAIPVKAVEVLPQVMTEAEARQCIAAIKGDVVSIRTRLVDLEERRGFEALGYPNISACMEAEFKQSRPTLVKELKAGRIEKIFLDVPIGTFLESHFRQIVKTQT